MEPQTHFYKILNAFSLSFRDNDLEQKFLSYYQKYVVGHIRLAMIISIGLYIGFAFLDIFLFPEYKTVFHQIRFFIVIPAIVLGVAYTFVSPSLKYLQPVTSLAVIVGGYGIIAMLYIGGEKVSVLYYVGLMLVMIFNYDFLKLRFVTASFVGGLIVIGYALVSIKTELRLEVLTTSLFFMLSVNIMGMASAYYFEFLSRKYFYSSLLLAKEKEKTAANNLYLEEQVLERTSTLELANKELFEAKNLAEDSERMKSVFLATMSHELRTPLNAIIGFSDIIHSGENEEEENISYAEIINRSGQHLLSLVESLFDITLIDSGQVKLNMGEFNLQELLANVNSIIHQERTKLGKDTVELKAECNTFKSEFIIKTDEDKIKQILINLLKNALKFTETGEIRFWCDEVTVLNKSYLKFFVKDTGIGIPSEKIDLIFDVFRQVDDTHSRKYGGVGIGLTVVRKLVTMLDGDVGVDSVEGEGSTFYFTIGNYIKVEKSPHLEVLPDSLEDYESIDAEILIVEDDEASYYLLEFLLEKRGAKIMWARNGEIALNIVKEHETFDLIMMDINMPFLSGYDTAMQIKELYPNQTIIAQTAYAVAGDKEKALEAGCDAYITKPISAQKLNNIITEFI